VAGEVNAARGALAGIRVADLTSGIAGPVAGMLLADLGADVIALGPPGSGPRADEPGRFMWGRGKRAYAVRPERAADLAAADALIRRADVVLAGAGPGAPGQHGLDHDSLRARGLAPGDPGLWVVMPPYVLGHTPWAGGGESAGLLSAWLGHAWNQSSYADVPVDCLHPLALYMQGTWAATAAVAALAGRQAGRSIAPVVVAGGAHGAQLVSPGVFAAGRDEPHVHRPGGPGGTLPNYRCYRCADGTWLFLGTFTTAFIERGFRAIGAAALLDDPRVGGKPEAVRAPANVVWIARELERAFATRPRDKWLAVLQAADVPVAAVGVAADWLDHPQVKAAGLRTDAVTDTGEPVVMPGPLLGLSATPVIPGPPAATHRPALAGLDLAGDLGWSPRRPGPPWATAAGHAGRDGDPATAATELPLAGRRVLDLGTIIAGPYTATLLGELGADVIKVERPPYGDEFRIAHGGRGGAGFLVYNRDQRSVLVDLGTSAGRVAFDALAATADVVVDNYRAGVTARLGIAHADLARTRPQLTSVSISAFGEEGPLRRLPGFDPVIQAMSGIMRAQGGPDEASSPAFLTVPVNDVLAAGLGALGAVAALYAAPRIGAGQQVSVTLCAASCLAQSAHLVRLPGAPPPPVGGRDFAGPSPSDRLYPCADGWARLGLPGSRDQAVLAHAGLADATTGAESDTTELASAVATALARLPVSEVLHRAAAAGIPAVRARQPQELVDDKELIRRGLLTVIEADTSGVQRVGPGRWLDMPGLTRPAPVSGPRAGEHDAEIWNQLG
jgi:crotonobetainyl-CoA:carnitine CoA-transferase CaiB-like acyl-CoA transferase